MRTLFLGVAFAVRSLAAVGAEPAAAGEEVVAVEDLTSVGRPGRTCTSVPAGTVLRVTRAEGDWLHVTHGGRPGWVARRFVAPAAEADAHFDRAVRDRPSAAAFLARGRLRLYRGEAAGAVADFDEAVRREPGRVEAYLLRAEIGEARGDAAAAEADLSEAIRRGPDPWERGPALARRAAARAGLGRYAEALADYDAAIEASFLRINPRAHAGKAWLLATCPVARFRDGRSAVGHARTACAQSSNGDAGHVATLAAAHAEAGEFATAAALQRAALEAVRVGAAGGDPEDYRARLASYESGRPYREGVGAAGASPGVPVEAPRP